jgi:hypothetical protein
MRRLLIVQLGSCLAVLAFAGVAQAETRTVGADFSTPVKFAANCAGTGGCGMVLVAVTSPSVGAVSPITGTVVRWRVEGTTATPGYALDVLRKNAGGTYTVTAATAPVTPLGTNPIETFSANLPIQAGEYVALNVPEGGGISLLDAPSTEAFFEPSLSLGETRAPGVEELPFAEGYNADIESAAPPASTPTLTPAPTPTPMPTPTPTPTVAPPAPVTQCVVPKLNGKKLKAAKKFVRAADCKVGLVSTKKGVRSATGKVVRQSPKGGEVIAAHSAVSLKLG